jgi:hypothetical protein
VSPCPIAPADRRLRDAFHLWKRLERTYFDPHEFRLNLNSFLQEARNVTFILQKNKKQIPGFEQWYARWQERLKNDATLRWVVDSRNRITKQGDLETESQSFVSFTTDWTDELTQKFRADPLVPSTVLVRSVLKKIPKEHISEESLLCVERRWVDTNLPGQELLDATSHVLVVLSALIEDAHDFVARTLVNASCDNIENLRELRTKYPIDAANAEDSRKVWTRAENLKTVKYSVTSEIFERGDSEKWKTPVIERYGLDPEVPADLDIYTLEGAAKMWQERAKQILMRDHHLAPFLFVLPRGERTAFYFALNMEDRVGKHLAIRRVASVLSRLDIKWALLVNEAWTAELIPGKPLPGHAIEASNREEAIALCGVSADGAFYNRTVKFSRRGDQIVFGDERADAGMTNIMLPIRKAIARRVRPLPDIRAHEVMGNHR